MRAYCFGISPYADQFLLLLLLRAERPREQCLLRLGAAGGRQRPERDHYSHSGGAASRRQREQHHRRRRRDRRAGPNRHVADHNTTPQAATPSHQFRHSPKVKTRRSHRLSNVRFRSAHASARPAPAGQTSPKSMCLGQRQFVLIDDGDLQLQHAPLGDGLGQHSPCVHRVPCTPHTPCATRQSPARPERPFPPPTAPASAPPAASPWSASLPAP